MPHIRARAEPVYTVVINEVALGYTLTLANQQIAARAVFGKSSGCDELMQALARTPLALSTRKAVERDMDKLSLQRYDRSDYAQWFGRKPDGRWYAFGMFMLMVRVRQTF